MASSNPFVGAAPGFAMQDPSIMSDQTALDRQMQLAQLLRQQSLSGFGPTEYPNGYAVKRSPLEGIAKVVQALMAGKMDKENDASRLSLAQKQGTAMQSMMAGLLGGNGGGAPQKAPDPSTMGGSDGMSASPDSPPQATQQENPQVAQLKRAATSAMLMGNTELANKLIGNLMELTTQQKDWGAQGIDPRQMAPYTIGAAAKAAETPATVSKPGDIARDPKTGAILWQNPEAAGEKDAFLRVMQQAGVDPKSPEGAALLKQWLVKQATHQPATQVSVNTGQHGFDNEMKLVQAFKTEPIYKDFADMQSAYKQIKAALSAGTPIGDTAGATKIMKLLDPGSVVRESELGMAMAAAGKMDRLQNYVQMQVSGTKLTPTQRSDFSALADDLMHAAGAAYNAKRDEYSNIGSRYKLDPTLLGPVYQPAAGSAKPPAGRPPLSSFGG